uniref:Uncharacterized protein n=1 Tax=Pithovirus LCPAC103 TaxID=2506588 RepID=A0A481Z3C0_9VIRU|nr:MAG: hypothetical protein LCPAC103_00250 [Pithovirus LCPAC103]
MEAEDKSSAKDTIHRWLDKLFDIADSDDLITTDPKSGLKLGGEDPGLCLARLKNKADTFSARKSKSRATTTRAYGSVPRRKFTGV